ncbi:MAG: thiol reductant ABC exporter subunit CydD [Acidimicrobiales bacterium]|nr:thiol reductant ABC exporter subunit CydD [Acidimicrobiales bacterium]
MRPFDPRLLHHARAARLALALDVGLGLATTVLLLAQAVLLARVVAGAFAGEAVADVAPELWALLAVVGGRSLCTWGVAVAGRAAAGAVLTSLRGALVERRLRERPAALDGAASAEVAAAAVQGVDALEAYFARYLPQLALALLVPPVVLVLTATIDLQSAVIMLLTLPLVPVFLVLVGRATEARTRARWEALARLSTHFLDVVTGLATLRAFNRGEAQTERIAAVTDEYRRTTMATLRWSFLSGAVLDLAATLATALVAVALGVRLVGGRVGFEAALTVLLLTPELYAPIRAVGARFHDAADGLAAAGRILDLIGDGTAPRRTPPTRPAPAPHGCAVRLEGVAFTYPSRPAPVLESVDLELRPGETVAIVGASGAGKSTLASLLLLLAAPSAGRVTAGGVDLSECDPAGWRRHLAWVPQHPTLFAGTVADNIRLGDPGASPERVAAAARASGAAGFIDELPDGYQTRVGEGGRPLSTGERRRIALARAFLRDASLVILDEPTADLDPAGAAVVAAAVGRLGASRTVVVLAHRDELARTADRVLRLEGGRLHLAHGVAP